MKRLIGANEKLRNIHGEGGEHGTGKPLTRAMAVGDLGDGQYTSAEDASKRWHAAYKLLCAAQESDAVVLEDADHEQVGALVEAAFTPGAMAQHGYRQGALVQLGDWLKTAEAAKVQLAEAAD